MKLAYRLAQTHGSKENNERIRYLSDAEEIKLRAVMQRAHADRIPEFEVALMTGMRMSEQLTLGWNQIDLDAEPSTWIKPKTAVAALYA